MKDIEDRIDQIHANLAKDYSELFLDGDPDKPIHNPNRTELEKRKLQAKYQGQIQDLRNQADQLRQQAQEWEFQALSFDPMSTLTGADQLSKAASLREFVLEDVAQLDWPELEARMRALLSGDFVRAGQEVHAVLLARYAGNRLAEVANKGGGAMAGSGKKAQETYQKLLDAIGGADVRLKREQAKAAKEKAARLEGNVYALTRHLETGKDPKSSTTDFVKKEF